MPDGGMKQTTTPVVVLLLEDEALIAIDLEFALREAGLEVVVFTHCAQADDWLETNSPHIAIIDITLADGVCIKTASTLAERKIPFIVHSGHAEISEHKGTVFEVGHWISKPAQGCDVILSARNLANISLARIG